MALDMENLRWAASMGRHTGIGGKLLTEVLDTLERYRDGLERIRATRMERGSELSMPDDEWRNYWSGKCSRMWAMAEAALTSPTVPTNEQLAKP